MIIYTHPSCLLHDPGHEHPESPARLKVVLDALHENFADADWREAPGAKRGDLLRVHAEALVDEILQPVSGLHQLDQDTFVNEFSRIAALHAAGSGIAAVDALMNGEDRVAFCAVRPPGHHATPTAAMGFCLFDNIAVAAAYALAQHGLERVAIVDFDVHHGNGTQAIFVQEPRVAYFSTHESGLFPYSGAPNERGAGNLHNALLQPGSDGFRFRNVWADELLPQVDAFQPQLLCISAGFDAHRADPMADLLLEAEDFAWITAELRRLADRHAGGRLLSMLEGGYDLDALRESVLAHLHALR